MSFHDDCTDTDPAPPPGPSFEPIERLAATARDLEPDALEVLCLVAERLRMGRRCYGALDLERDPRDFKREALEEYLDGSVYLAAGLIRRIRSDADERPRRMVGAERE